MKTSSHIVVVSLSLVALCFPPPSHGQPAMHPAMHPAARPNLQGRDAQPSLADLVGAAVAHAGSPVQRARRMQRRARRAGWLPRLRIGVRHGRARDAHIRDAEGGYTANRSMDEDLALDISLTFRLGQLVYALPTASLLRYEARARRAERALTDRVVDLYYERLTLLCTRPNPPISPDQRRLRIAHVEAELALLTRGRSRWLPPSEEGVEVQLAVWCASPEASPQHIRTDE